MATVTAELGSGTNVTVRARQFSWLSDEPQSAGGTDTGPTPYEILLGGLAACTAVTLRLYANHKGIPLHRVEVTLGFDRVHADDCEDCDERMDGWIERIRSSVVISGEFAIHLLLLPGILGMPMSASWQEEALHTWRWNSGSRLVRATLTQA